MTFGLSAPLISTLSSTGSPLVLAGLLYGGSALAMLAARAVRGQSNQESPVKRQDLGMLTLLTLIGGIAAPMCLVSGLALLSAGSASLLPEEGSSIGGSGVGVMGIKKETRRGFIAISANLWEI